MALGGGVRPFLAAIALLSLGVSAFKAGMNTLLTTEHLLLTTYYLLLTPYSLKAGMNTLLINAAPHAQVALTHL